MYSTLRVLVFGLILAVTFSCHSSAQILVDDDFADGDRAQTGALDSSWWTSSSSSGIEISPGSLGLVTGNSGRGIHTLFPMQTLANVGDQVNAEYTFTTPASIDVSGGNSASFRVGLFDSLGRGLNMDTSASSGSPNPVYGCGAAVTACPSNATGLPGFMLDMDVFETGDTDPAVAETDLNFRQHQINGITESGRLMATTSGWSGVGSSGPDAGYTFAPNTEYSGSFSIRRTSATEVMLIGSLGSDTYSETGTIGAMDSFNFDMLGFHANSNKFGTSNVPDTADNGIDFSRVTISVKNVPEPATVSLLGLAGLALLGFRRR